MDIRDVMESTGEQCDRVLLYDNPLDCDDTFLDSISKDGGKSLTTLLATIVTHYSLLFTQCGFDKQAR